MGQLIKWQYALIWTPDSPASEVNVYRISTGGHRFLWASAVLPASEVPKQLDGVLEEFYAAVLALMEATC